MSGSTSVPIVLTAAGRTNTPPATINANIIALATSYSPGLTILPAGLIEDLASTATGAAVQIDQCVTEFINSLTPYAANNYLLSQLAQIYLGQGSTNNAATNPSAYVVFTGPAGFIIAPGFIVSDTVNQYTVADGGIIQTGGTSQPIYVQATVAGTYAIPANSIQSLITSVPTGVNLSVTNPTAGTPGGLAETPAAFRARVLQAGLAVATGMPNLLMTALQAIPGVVPNLCGVRLVQGSPSLWEVIVGGTGDQYAIGYAIYSSLFDITSLTGSTLAVMYISTANPGVVTTDLNHNYVTGQLININGVVGMTNINGTPLIVETILSPTSFTLNVDTTSYGTYVAGGVVTPNFRNTTVTLNQYPDSYTIPFVIPPEQQITMVVTWNTSTYNFVSPTNVAQAVQPALAAYINNLAVGAPISLLELNDVFLTAVGSQIQENLITTLVFAVYINGVQTQPDSGTQTIYGDPESYMSMTAAAVTVIQG
jgi:hypothetical protein